MQRSFTIAACALAFALAWLAAPPRVAQEATGEAPEPQQEKAADAPEAEEEPEESPADAAAQPRARGRVSGSRLVWWNDLRVVEELSLSEEQREKMDAYLEAFRQTAPPDGQETFASFMEALGAGEWKEARSELKRLSEQASAPIRARGELKIDVLSVLSDEQREKLAERYPRLIRQRWTAVGGRPPAGRRPGPGPRRRQQPAQ